jgi:hypothetical protein
LHFNTVVTSAYDAVQTYEARKLAVGIHNDTLNQIEHADRFAGAIALRVLYDADSPDLGSEEIARVTWISHTITKTLRPGYSIISIFPWFRHLPEWLLPSKKLGRLRVEASNALEEHWLEYVENKMVRPWQARRLFLSRLQIEKPNTVSFMADCLRNKVADKKVIAALAEGLYLGARGRVWGPSV